MYAHNVVAFFPSITMAESAKSRLIQAGIDQSAIRLSQDGTASHTSEVSTRKDENQGFFEWLFGSDDDVPENERSWYSSNLSDGRAALSVRLDSQQDISRIEQLLETEGALEVERDDETTSAGLTQTAQFEQDSRSTSASTAKARDYGAEDEEVIPVVKEELAVGKRTHETRRRVRTHVIERPVQEQVQLQDETVIIERRPISGDRAANTADLQAREFEIIERHEEPVVEKRARATEEVVVKKDVRSRTETVSDTVRETQVDVEGKTVPGSGKKKL